MHDRARRLQASADRVEQQLVFLGVTAIEDRLQEGVSTTLSALVEAGVKPWILTGDKLETAINIARASGLLPLSIRGDSLIPLVDARDLAAVTASLGHVTQASQPHPFNSSIH